MRIKRSPRRFRPLRAAVALQLAAGSGLAAQSGVLLGVATPGVGHAEAGYRTLWITTAGDSAAVTASGPGILVPRRDGFWHLSIIPACTTYEPWDLGEICDRLVDMVRVPERHRAVEPKVIVTDPDTLGAVGPCWLRTTNAPRFVGTDHISLDVQTYSEGCSASGWDADESLGLYAIGHRSVSAGDRLVPARLEPLVGAEITAAVDSSREAFFGEPGPGAQMEACEYYGGIGIARGTGRWEVVGWSTGRHVCGAPFALYSSGLAAPDSIVGHDELFPSLDTLRALIPDTRDAVSSPGRDLVVVLTTNELLAIRVRDGRLGTPQILGPRAGDIVMAQWALGRHVMRWTEEVTPWLTGSDPRSPRDTDRAARSIGHGREAVVP